MSENRMGGYTSSTEFVYGNLSYEQLLARAVDRCLHNRVIDPGGMYIQAVQALHLSLVDIGKGKPLRTRADEEEKRIRIEYHDQSLIIKSDALFSSITKILADSKMLFRSIMLETGREQV